MTYQPPKEEMAEHMRNIERVKRADRWLVWLWPLTFVLVSLALVLNVLGL